MTCKMPTDMDDIPNQFGGRASAEEIKEMRRDYPSGWLELTMFESLAFMIDALIDAPPAYMFTNPELADRAGLSDESVRNRIDILEELGVVRRAPDGHHYQVNDDSRVLQEILGLNDAVNAVRSGASPSIQRPSSGISPENLSEVIPDSDRTKTGGKDAPGASEIGRNTATSFS